MRSLSVDAAQYIPGKKNKIVYFPLMQDRERIIQICHNLAIRTVYWATIFCKVIILAETPLNLYNIYIEVNVEREVNVILKGKAMSSYCC